MLCLSARRFLCKASYSSLSFILAHDLLGSPLSAGKSLPSLFAGKYSPFPFLPLHSFPVPSCQQMAAFKKKKSYSTFSALNNGFSSSKFLRHCFCCCRERGWLFIFGALTDKKLLYVVQSLGSGESLQKFKYGLLFADMNTL